MPAIICTIFVNLYSQTRSIILHIICYNRSTVCVSRPPTSTQYIADNNDTIWYRRQIIDSNNIQSVRPSVCLSVNQTRVDVVDVGYYNYHQYDIFINTLVIIVVVVVIGALVLLFCCCSFRMFLCELFCTNTQKFEIHATSGNRSSVTVSTTTSTLFFFVCFFWPTSTTPATTLNCCY